MADMTRPARRQKKRSMKGEDTEAAGDYNIWYHKWTGFNYRQGVEKALSRVNVKKDSGLTQAYFQQNPTICVFFARGACSLGPKCKFLHRIPIESDEQRFDFSKDCFGRAKFADDRDDHGGVGSFLTDNRTLYVGRIPEVPDIENRLKDTFSEFGEVVNLRYIGGKNIAFVEFKLRACAEFAKEALFGQDIDGHGILNVRWAIESEARKPLVEAAAEDSMQDALGKRQDKLEELSEQREAALQAQAEFAAQHAVAPGDYGHAGVDAAVGGQQGTAMYNFAGQVDLFGTQPMMPVQLPQRPRKADVKAQEHMEGLLSSLDRGTSGASKKEEKKEEETIPSSKRAREEPSVEETADQKKKRLKSELNELLGGYESEEDKG